MRISEISDTTADAVRAAGTYLSDLATPTLRLGVTGLSRAGKTVFIVALVRALTKGGARPRMISDRLTGYRAFLEPQPDDDIPRFAYEQHLRALTGAPPEWPESTRQISQLRLTLEWEPSDWARRTAGIGRRLHLDIVDYPGEWLLDLGLLEQSYRAWCDAVLASAEGHARDGRLEAWMSFVGQQSGDSAADEQVAMQGAELYTAYLASVRDNDRYARNISPGRFLMPGDLAGSPLLTFFPLRFGAADSVKPGTLGGLMERRFESYKAQVVRPFFERHFKSLDRQIVLVDTLGALNGGAAAMIDLELALQAALSVFRPGANSWLGRLLGRRIDRVLFAATKADHLNSTNHGRLERIMGALMSRAVKRAEAAGAEIDVAAIASLKATEDVEYHTGGNTLPCIRGRPLAGEVVGSTTFDGATSTALFPGDLPEDPLDVFDRETMAAGTLTFVRFQPPELEAARSVLHAAPWPHVGLEHVVQFLLGDRLA